MTVTIRRPRPRALWCFQVLLTLTTCAVCLSYAEPSASSKKDDVHGGVPMGVWNKLCDNAKVNTSIDWDPSDTDIYTCLENVRPIDSELKHYYICEGVAKRPLHICYPEVIQYDEDLPTSGRHRPLWPKYGEYTYLPIQRWLHSLEHGAIVFLYHPCADPDLIANFKAIAKTCLRRHIISPSKRIPSNMNFAVLSWKCKLLLSLPDLPAIVQFVRSHAIKAPEASVYSDGQYDTELIDKASMISDLKESDLCPQSGMLGVSIQRLNNESVKRREQLSTERQRLHRLFYGRLNGYY